MENLFEAIKVMSHTDCDELACKLAALNLLREDEQILSIVGDNLLKEIKQMQYWLLTLDQAYSKPLAWELLSS